MVPQSTYLREEILREFHRSHFAMHLGGMKMYHDLRRHEETRWGLCLSMSHMSVSKG